ncbi:MAG: hypothetical protein AAF686_08620 [Pseudomonadota bacterium]
MWSRLVLITAMLGNVPGIAPAQETAPDIPVLYLELNALSDVDQACRLSFVARNETDRGIEKAVFETVIFDANGGVARLSLFDFRDLPLGRPRVRQFDLADISCAEVGRVLINGASNCIADGETVDLCDRALSVASRLDVELIG